jgi:Flp pilus assembly pilin Flp
MSRIEESGAAVVAERVEERPAGIGQREVRPSTSSSAERVPGGGGDAVSCCACVGGARPSVRSLPTRAALAARRAVRSCLVDDDGAATAEYAIATMAAVAFAGLLVVILQSDEVRGMLLDLVRRALTYDK